MSFPLISVEQNDSLGMEVEQKVPVTFSRKDKHCWAFGALQGPGKVPEGTEQEEQAQDMGTQEGWTHWPQPQQQLLQHHLQWWLFPGITPQNTQGNGTTIPTNIWGQPQLLSTSSSEQKGSNSPLQGWLCRAPGILEFHPRAAPGGQGSAEPVCASGHEEFTHYSC